MKEVFEPERKYKNLTQNRPFLATKINHQNLWRKDAEVR